jgi:hypothetical protein
MANIKIIQTANFGRGLGGRTGNTSISLYDTLGNLYAASNYLSSSIYEIPSNSGIYGSELTINTLFSGSIVWSVVDGNGTTSYATEEVKVDQKMARYIHTGDWIIDENTKQMIFYADDGTTELARYDLKDRDGTSSIDEIFERVLVK